VYERVPDDLQEGPIVEQLVVIAKTNVGGRAADHLVLKADRDRGKERVDDDKTKHQDGRQKEEQRDDPLIVHELGTPGRRGHLPTQVRANRLFQHAQP
jgi:hypothetical protein